MSRAVLLFVSVMVAAGCGGGAPLGIDAGDDPDVIITDGDGGGPRVVAGSATDDGSAFLDVPDGTDVTLAPGSQGGFHVWIGLRAKGLSGSFYLRHLARRVSDDALVLRGGYQYVTIPESALDTWWERESAAPAFMCPTPIGLSVRNTPIRFTVEVFTTDEEFVTSDQIVLTPHCPETNQQDFCIEICSGN